MEFKLNDYHRNLSNEELIADLVATATLLKKNTLTSEEYNLYGKYAHTTVSRHFGSWSNALEKAGLSSHQKLNNWCNSLDEFIDDVKSVAQKLNQSTLSIGQYKKYGKYQYLYPSKRHGLCWSDVLKLANLEQTQFRLGHRKEITCEELFSDIERVWIQLGRQPTISDIKKGYFKFSQNTFCRRFGGWRKALNAFVAYINSDINNSCYGELENTENVAFKEIVIDKKPFHKRGNREPNLRMRFRIMQRDNFKCCLCGRSPASDPSVQLVIDHIHPWVRGGETTYDNLQTLCQECNLGKSDLI